MEGLIDLTKKVEVVLDLRKIADLKAQVMLAVDGSGSMQHLYNNGTVQRTVDRVSAVAMKFDDNQELDVVVFSNDVNEAAAATPQMFGNYVQRELLGKRLVQFEGTSYVPFIRHAVSQYFGDNLVTGLLDGIKGVFGFGKKQTDAPTSNMSKSGFPVFCIVITDGENDDKTATTALLSSMRDKNIYWQFIGIGHERFTYLRQTAAALPNVGFFEISDLSNVKDMELYKQLVSEEFATWVKKF